ncbi:MAG: VCBS repeat-containing protein, partial [Myxococcota bacterium]
MNPVVAMLVAQTHRVPLAARGVVFGLAIAPLLALAGCGDGRDDVKAPTAAPAATTQPESAPKPARAAKPALPDELPLALVLSLSVFPEREAGAEGPPVPLPSELEFIQRKGGKWVKTRWIDPDSNVFHKAMAYQAANGEVRLLTGGGSKALLKLWSKQHGKLVAETLWERDFGGRFSRMREMEVGDVDGNGSSVIVIATHDQGVVAVVRPQPDGSFAVEELDREKDTFVHEIELGDLDGDGAVEIYATPSEPNKLDGSSQSGRVVRYVPSKGEGPTVVADLSGRHAKEILVHDIDGDGKDELYVFVEGQKNPEGKGLLHRTEVWRYEADTPPAEGVVIAEFNDRLGRFLTPSDLDGDGEKEIVATLFQAGVWWLRPGEDPNAKWKKKSIDRQSSSFEHAAIAADLDGDGVQELYVASDKHKALRRYVWNGRRLVKEEIYKRNDDRSILTWNIMPIPVALIP